MRKRKSSSFKQSKAMSLNELLFLFISKPVGMNRPLVLSPYGILQGQRKNQGKDQTKVAYIKINRHFHSII